MAYNQFLYNSALYNAGREEIGAIARSIIQAHTGPHIQAVVGSTGGVSFISDFVIQEGEIKKPPTRFNFPDLQAFLRAVYTDTDNLSAYIRGWAYKDLPAAIYPVVRIPNLPASIFGLFESGLLATIVGVLGQHDLSATIQAAVLNLPAVINELLVPYQKMEPKLFAVVNELLQPGQKMEPKLFARIHSPLDLPAFLNPVQKTDLLGSIRGFQVAILAGQMLGIPSPAIVGFIRGFSSGTLDLPSSIRTSPVGAGILPSTITPVFTGDTGYLVGLSAEITSSGGFKNITTTIRGLFPAQCNLGAFIKTAGNIDLLARVYPLGADNLAALVGAIPLGEKDKELAGFLQPFTPRSLSAYLNPDPNVAFLGARIAALRDTADVGAFIRVAETFVTAILTISTLSARSLRATVGRPDCLGGSASTNLGASAIAQHAGNLGASITSFLIHNLGATINTPNIFHAFDMIDINFSPKKVRFDTQFLAYDSIPVSFSPFRGKNLGASITAVLRDANLAASVTSTFPLPSVVPTVSTLNAVNLQAGEPQNWQEIRVLLEGQVKEFLYVHGAEEVFTQDANADWKINVSSFKPIASNLFGDFAAARIRRLGSLTSFATLDAAIRFCIQAVIGFSEESNLSASITGTGGTAGLAAHLGATSIYRGLPARILPVMNNPVLFASVEGSKAGLLYASIRAVNVPATASMSATIAHMDGLNLGASINWPAGAQPPFAYPANVSAYIRPHVVSSLTSYIQADWSKRSLVFNGVIGEYARGPVMGDLGDFDEKLTVAFWLQAQSTPLNGEGILGTYSDYLVRDAGFGFRWVDSNTIEFSINGIGDEHYARADIVSDAQWHFVTGVYDATAGADNIKLYLNAEPGAVTGNCQQPVLGLDNPLFLGKTSNVNSGSGWFSTETPLNAYVDSLGVWEDALSPTEIGILYAERKRDWRPYYVARSGYDSADALALCWTFEDTDQTFPLIESASFTAAASGIAVNLTANNVSSHVPSSNSVSMYTDSSFRYWRSVDSDSQPLPSTYQGSFSICWVGTFEYSGYTSLVGMWKSGDVTGSPSFRIFRRDEFVSDGTKLHVEMQDEYGVEQVNFIGNTPLAESTTVWHSIVFTYDADTSACVLYVDGVIDGSETMTGVRDTSTEFLLSASRWNGSVTDYHRGKVDSLAVWDKVLSDTEVALISDLTEEVWLAAHPTLRVNLRTWYRNGEVGDTSTRIYDWSGNGGPYLERVGSAASITKETPN